MAKRRLCARTLQFVACRLREEADRKEATGGRARSERRWASVFADLSRKVKQAKRAAAAPTESESLGSAS